MRVNEDIRSSHVLLVDTDGNKLGIVTKSVALDKARDRGLDLVEVASQANPPVCRIMDYSRFYFEKKKKVKENKKKSRSAQLKQIRLSPNIGKHDLKVKFDRMKGFLEKGHTVKVNMMFKGRQKEHLDVGKEILYGIIREIEPIAACQSEPNFEGFYMSMVLVPVSEGKGK